MTTVIQRYAERKGQPVFICDVSPTRGADLAPLKQAKEVGADFLCVAYSPGKSVRVDSTVTAHLLNQGDREVIFNLACRDMNKLAVQSHLLGAQLLGLENVMILRGDNFTEEELANVKDVNDYRPTELIRAIKTLNEGVDYRGLRLRAPTSFCVGATLDLNRDAKRECGLTRNKVVAGADYFITQSFYDVAKARCFLQQYWEMTGEELVAPVFYGVQVLNRDALMFGEVPPRIQEDLAKGRSGIEIVVEQMRTLADDGLNTFYVVPPILRGGRRDYAAVRQALEQFRR